MAPTSTKVEITHPDRVLFPEDGVTKGELVEYYAEVADVMVFDLDPSTTDFAPVRAAARACADVLGDPGLTSYLKTTGSRGLHVVVPISRGADFDTVRQFARDVAAVVAADDPDHRTVEQ